MPNAPRCWRYCCSVMPGNMRCRYVTELTVKSSESMWCCAKSARAGSTESATAPSKKEERRARRERRRREGRRTGDAEAAVARLLAPDRLELADEELEPASEAQSDIVSIWTCAAQEQ